MPIQMLVVAVVRIIYKQHIAIFTLSVYSLLSEIGLSVIKANRYNATNKTRKVILPPHCHVILYRLYAEWSKFPVLCRVVFRTVVIYFMCVM